MLSLLPIAAVLAAAPGKLQLGLIDNDTGDPVDGALVELVERGTVVTSASSGVTGSVELTAPPGVYQIRVTHPGYELLVDEEALTSGRTSEVRVRMRVPASATVLIVDERLGDEVNKTVVSIDELKSVPGTFGDPVRGLQTLPGVARPNVAEGSLVVRGAEGLNTGYYVDGMPVPYMFHTLVGRSVIPAGFIDDIEFFPGGMPSRYGEVTQAAVNVRTDTEPVGRTKSMVGLNVLDGSLAIEHRLSDKVTIRAAGRYSWMHALIWSGSMIAVMRAGGESYEAGYFSPKYADLFADARWEASPQDSVSLLFIRSRDRLILRQGRYDEDGDGEPDPPDWEQWDLPYDPEAYIDNGFTRARLRWDHDGEQRDYSTWVALGQESQTNLLGAAFLSREGPYRGRVTGTSLIVRRDEVFDLGGQNRLVYGGQLTLRPVVAEDFQGVWADPEADIPTTTDDQVSAGLWIEPQIRTERFYLAPGVRGSAYVWNGQTAIQPEPRLSMRYDLNEDWLLKGAIGRYTQMPPVERYAQGIGNPDLPLMKAWQASLGAEGPLPGSWSMDASVYGAVMNDLIVRNLRSDIYQDEGVAYSELRPEFLSVMGYAYGLEGLLRMQPGQRRYWGWVSITLGRAIRVDKGLGTFSGDYDQPLSFQVLGAYDLSDKWEISSRAQFTSGQPHTPLYGVYVPEDAFYTEYRGEINSDRYPAYFRWDLRIQRTWQARRVDWVWFLDVYNVTWRKNAFAAAYDFDYSELVPIAHLPLLPTLGIEAKF